MYTLFMRTYTILEFDSVTSDQWNDVIERIETCRKSLDGVLVVLKWEGATPASMIGAPQYSHPEILAIMATEEWTDPDPPELAIHLEDDPPTPPTP